jgi:hypothetical protein
MRGVSKAMKAQGLRLCFAGSALAAWSDLAKSLIEALSAADAPIGRKVFALDMNADSMRLLLFVDGGLAHRQEYSLEEGLDEDGLIDLLRREIRRVTLYSENREGGNPLRPDCVLVAGERAGGPGLAEKMAGQLGVPCVSLGDCAEQLDGALCLGDEMAGRTGLYAKAASLAGGPAVKEKARNFLYGGARRRRERTVTLAAFAAIALLAAAGMAALPIANHYVDGRRAEIAETIARPLYAEAREQLMTQRQLGLQLQNYLAEEAYMQAEGLSYASLLYEMREGALKGAAIESLTRERGSNAAKAVFTTDDIDYFLLEKERLDAGGRLKVEEPLIMEKLDGGLWRCDVTISWQQPS